MPGAKDTAGIPTNQMSSTASGSPQSGGLDQWNPFQEIRNMQSQMDRLFNQMNEQFQGRPVSRFQ